MGKLLTIFCSLIPILLILDLADANVFTAINLHWTNQSLRECKRECDLYTPAYWTNTLPNWEQKDPNGRPLWLNPDENQFYPICECLACGVNKSYKEVAKQALWDPDYLRAYFTNITDYIDLFFGTCIDEIDNEAIELVKDFQSSVLDPFLYVNNKIEWECKKDVKECPKCEVPTSTTETPTTGVSTTESPSTEIPSTEVPSTATSTSSTQTTANPDMEADTVPRSWKTLAIVFIAVAALSIVGNAVLIGGIVYSRKKWTVKWRLH